MNDVIIIGAGPAGLSAAIACANHGLKVKVFDEYLKTGGRLLGQLHQEPDGEWWNGIKEANNLFEKASSLSVSTECGMSVVNIEKGEGKWKVHTSKGLSESTALLLATGAAEVPAPVPGWTLPGVMSIGAAQVMTNVQRVKVGERGVVIGVNVLSAAITNELQMAGIHVDRLVLPGADTVNETSGNPEKVMQSMLRFAHLAPSRIIGFGSKLIKPQLLQKLGIQFFPKNGVKIWGIPVQLRKAAVEICGEDHVEGVKVADVTPQGKVIKNTETFIPADFVCIAGGLYPLVELAAIAGCPFHFIPELGGHIPLHNEEMQTPLDSLYVAGNITGIESAKVAIAQGSVAGLSIVKNSEAPSALVDDLIETAKNHVEAVRRNAVIQFHPNIKEGRQTLKRQWQEQQTAF